MKDQEIEVKIAIAPELANDVFEKMKVFAKGEISDKHHPRDYYDTKDFKLRDQRAVLRLQYKEDQGDYEQSIKYKPDDTVEIVDGVKALSEWNYRVTQPQPDLSVITESEAKALFNQIAQEDLFHIFTTDIERFFFTMDVPMPNGDVAEVELAFDNGNVRLADCEAVVHINEIEVELKSGAPEAVNIVKDQILSLEPSAKTHEKSKSAYGYELYQKKQAGM